MAAAVTGAPVVQPDTYFTKYSASVDALSGDYAQLHTRHAVSQATTPADLLDRLAVASELIPKVFLVEVMLPDGNLAVTTVFRVTKFVPHPIQASFWDDKIFGFMGDVEVNNFINIVELTEELLEVTAEGTVHTVGTVDAAIQAQPGQTALDFLATGAANTEKVQSRYMVQVPHAYIPLVLNQLLSPIEAWATLGGAIMADGNEIACSHVVNWLRLAMTYRANAVDPTAPDMPATYMGELTTAFPPLAVDGALNSFRWGLLRSDLPVLDRAGYAVSEPLLHVIREMRDERKEERERAEERRSLDTAVKLPSSVFPATTGKWLRLTSLDREVDLPDIYHLWANSGKHERRLLLSDKVAERAAQEGAATTFEPIVSKELYEKVSQGNVAPGKHQIEDLSLGLQPFALGNFVGDILGDTIQARAAAWDLMMAGSTAPTLGEQYTFSTKEIRLPTDVYTAGLMLKTTSVIFDVVLGVGNAHASRFRYFCVREWPELEATLHVASMENPELLPAVLPRIVRWVQVRHVRYFKDRMDHPHPPNLPDYRNLVDMVLDRGWHNLPTIPDRYKVPIRPHKIPTDSQDRTDKGKTDKPVDRDGKDKASMVQNPKASTAWVKAFVDSGKKLPDIQQHAPLTKQKGRDGDLLPVCLSWHLKGTCFSNCKRAGSHRALSTEEQSGMVTLVEQQLQVE